MADNKISVDKVRDFLKFVAEFNPDEAMVVLVAMKHEMVTATTTNDVYRVPEDYKLAIVEIRGHLASLAADTEQVLTTPVVADLRNKMYGKAMNCRIKLQNLDTSIKITDGSDETISLASILVELGGKPIDLHDNPHIVKGGQSLRMDASLISGAANLLGQNTEYGVLITGILVRTKGD